MSTESALSPGQVLLQKYRIEKPLGRGGMGVVFSAWHLALEERVAIKVLTSSAREHEEALARFQREARILARVRNEHVVRVIDLGQLDDGAPFMVMEHLTGRDLARLLEEHGRFEVEPAVDFIMQALVALATAHAHGVVHRDLKPDNLFCVERPDGARLIKILDFGISRLQRSGSAAGLSSMTNPHALMGTPLYMSPEQLRDPKAVNARSDIWSIGVVLYELVSGVCPFEGPALGDIAVKIATEPPPPLKLADTARAAGLEAVLLRCLEKNPEKRFANVVELARALKPFGSSACERWVTQVERLAEGTAVSPPSELAPSPASTPPPRRRLMPVLWTSGALILAGAASWPLFGARDGATRGTSPKASSTAQAMDLLPRAVSLAPAPSSGPEWMPNNTVPAPEPPASIDKPRPSPSPNVAAKAFCNPPYTIDAQGRKKFRHECFIERSAR